MVLTVSLGIAFAASLAQLRGYDDLVQRWPLNDDACPTKFGSSSIQSVFQVMCELLAALEIAEGYLRPLVALQCAG